MIHRFLKVNEDPKPTVGLDYRYGRRERQGDFAKRDVAHVWELGGGHQFSELLNVCITPENLTTTCVVIVLDLAVPEGVYHSAYVWLQAVQERARNVLEEIAKTKPGLARRIKEQAAKRFGNVADGVNVVPVKTILAVTKWDQFSHVDAELKKIMGRSLRHLAHTNGAGVVYTSTASEDATLMSRFKAVLNNAVFGAPPPKGAVSDHNKPLFVMSGADSLEKIGKPPSSTWASSFSSVFGAPPGGVEAATQLPPVDEEGRYHEATVDSMRAQKNEELERYRKASARRSRAAQELTEVENQIAAGGKKSGEVAGGSNEAASPRTTMVGAGTRSVKRVSVRKSGVAK